MKKKLMKLAVALVLSLVVLTGCGKPKPTVESLVDGMFDNEIESLTMEIEANIEISSTIQGDSSEVSISLDSEGQISGLGRKGDLICYADGKMTVDEDSMGKDRSEFKGYMVFHDGPMTYYLYDEYSDTWCKMEMDFEIEKSDALAELDERKEALMDVLKEDGELAEDTEKVEGEECYVITATVKGDDVSAFFKPAQSDFDDPFEAFEEMAEVFEGAGINLDIDWHALFKCISMDITCYISEDTGYPVKIEVDASDTDLYGLVEQIVKGTGLDDYGIMEEIEELSFLELYFSAVISDINDTEVEVPDDVIDNAIEIKPAINDLMGSIGDDPIETDPVETDPNEYEDEEYYTLNKCDASSEKLVDVYVSAPWYYDSALNVYSDDGRDMFLVNEDGGYIFICNEAYEPLYTYATAYARGQSVDDSDREYIEENGYLDYDCDFRVVGTAFYGSALILAEESFTYDDGRTRSDDECTYLLIAYVDDGFLEFLMVDFYGMDIDDWSDEDFEELARDLFGN
ncbi:MAG: hypothetical protein K2J95_03625 [Lachnospiraceae bacterium]|nr:hypothetical protein [Lachnospiraceae bacterium]